MESRIITINKDEYIMRLLNSLNACKHDKNSPYKNLLAEAESCISMLYDEGKRLQRQSGGNKV